MDMKLLIKRILTPVFDFISGTIFAVLAFVAIVALVWLLTFYIRARSLGIRFKKRYLPIIANKRIGFPPYNFVRWMIYDIMTIKDNRGQFRECGFTIYVGRQGSGKTISMVHYLDKMRKLYPEILIVTNFYYKYSYRVMKDWNDFLTIRNGTKGVIFAIDEIHSEYDSDSWKDFPESLLSEISQQRKQRVKIVATAQVFSRVAKPIREQTFSVIVCKTFLGRLTYTKEYDAAVYSTADTPYTVKKRCKPIHKSLFVQSNHLRNHYDTYEKIERMKKIKFIPRHEKR